MKICLRRRDFIAGLGGAATWPLAARAQQRTTVPVIGFMHSGISGQYDFVLGGFREGLREAGYVEGRNLAVEYRWGNNELERLRALATDLVRLNVAVIVAGGTVAPALAAKEATSAIPIVAVFGGDPVRVGLITSLNRPEGNVTGISYNSGALIGKTLDYLHDLVPQASRLAILSDSRFAVAGESAKRIALGAPLLWRDVGHALAVCDVDEVERRAGDEALNPGICANVVPEMRQERVRARLVEPDAVGHRGVDVDDHDVAPIRGGAVAARTVDAEGSPQQAGRNTRGWSAAAEALPLGAGRLPFAVAAMPSARHPLQSPVPQQPVRWPGCRHWPDAV